MTGDTSHPPQAPEEWPPEILDEYEPVRALGKGGFGSVMLAKRRDAGEGTNDKLVAIKLVGSHDPSRAELGYAHREMDILKELSHPRIMRLIHVWEPPPEARKCAAVMALSYAAGPTLEYILTKIGAPCLTFGRVVSAQLVDAVAYLHSRAVIHRDIKPDNVVITGASIKQDELKNCDAHVGVMDPDWKKWREKWHLTLVDFGFARALEPDDASTDVGLRNSMQGGFTPRMTSSDLDTSLNASMTNSSSRTRRRNNSIVGSTLSTSRHLVRRMSALGNRSYAAPEVKNKVRRENNLEKVNDKSGTRQMSTLSTYVADYGMVADAYSVGSTIRFILTGVHPDDKVEDVIAAQKAPLAKAARWFGKKMSKKQSDDGTSLLRGNKKSFRASSDIPAEAVRMVKGMTHGDPKRRTTVRAARLYPWVDDVLEPSAESPFRTMEFLKCASRKNATKKGKVVICVDEDDP